MCSLERLQLLDATNVNGEELDDSAPQSEQAVRLARSQAQAQNGGELYSGLRSLTVHGCCFARSADVELLSACGAPGSLRHLRLDSGTSVFDSAAAFSALLEPFAQSLTHIQLDNSIHPTTGLAGLLARPGARVRTIDMDATAPWFYDQDADDRIKPHLPYRDFCDALSKNRSLRRLSLRNGGAREAALLAAALASRPAPLRQLDLYRSRLGAGGALPEPPLSITARSQHHGESTASIPAHLQFKQEPSPSRLARARPLSTSPAASSTTRRSAPSPLAFGTGGRPCAPST